MTMTTSQYEQGATQLQAPKLSVKNVRKSYGGIDALAGVSLDIRDGEFLSLLGPSGSGKTTLLMAVAGLSHADSGEIWIDGKLSTELPPHKRNVGMVFQSYALFPHMTVRENIAFPLRMRGNAEATIRKEVDRVLEVVQMPQFAERLPAQLSGGQKQRIALARCIVYRPPIVLMDEPMGALDKNLRIQLQLEIRRLHREIGTTIMYVTHDQEEALVMSDRICLMKGGSIEQIGTPQDLYFRPETRFAAGFVGESNHLPAEVVGMEEDKFVLDIGNGARALVSSSRPFATGAKVILAIRPEHTALVADGELRANETTGVVREVVFGGHQTNYVVELDTGSPVSVSSVSSAGDRHLDVGSRVKVGWDARDAVVVP